MRDALVTHAMPQNSWPTVAATRTNLFAHGSSALEKIASDEPPPELIASTSFAANRNASRRTQPMTPDQNTDRHTPCAAPMAAPFVSSEMCADASQPVCVYIVSRKPSGST